MKKTKNLLIGIASLIAIAATFFSTAQAADCIMTGLNGFPNPIASGQSLPYYSTLLRSITGQNYTDCSPYSGMLTCNNGVIQGGAGIYKYTAYECANTLSPKDCTERSGGQPIENGVPATAYSMLTGTYPHTCADYATTLTCVNGLLNGNYATYKYNTCTGDTTQSTDPVDLTLKVDATDYKVAQYSSPKLNISINNIGQFAITGNFSEGFIQCDWKQGDNRINIYKSRPLTEFVANPMVPQNISITLKDVLTQSTAVKYIVCEINKGRAYFNTENTTGNNVRSGYIQVVTSDRFDIAMERAVEPIKGNLDAPEITSALGGAETIKEFVFKKVMDIMVPLIILIGILSAILGFYKMFFSTDDTATQEGVKYITFGLIGIIVIMSAKFIGTTMFNLLTPASGELSGSIMAQGVYNDLIYPFIKLAMYLVLGAMFIVLVGRALTFLFGTSDEAKKKAGTIIGRNIIAMIVIIAAKQIVEMIYGKVNDVIKPISNLGEIGSGILADKNLPILYHVINRIMGLTSLIVLIIIILQTVQLLMKPDSPEQMKSLKNSLLYVFVGLIVIGAGYLITNFLIVS